jgi:hypothetical protein
MRWEMSAKRRRHTHSKHHVGPLPLVWESRYEIAFGVFGHQVECNRRESVAEDHERICEQEDAAFANTV